MSEINYRLEVYEGPLDLLLSLIAKNKVDIKDIPIALIFDQYMEYIAEMNSLDMEIAGEFIVMASELMLIKSRMLLPRNDEDEEDPRADLAAALIEYKKAKEAAVYLGPRFTVFSGRVSKDTDEIKPDNNIVLDQDVKLLQDAFRRLLSRRREDDEELEKRLNHNEDFFTNELKNDIVQIPERLIGVISYLSKLRTASFDEIMYTSHSRSELIATFAALLELLKAGRLRISYSGRAENADGDAGDYDSGSDEIENGEIFLTINDENMNDGVLTNE